MGMTTACHVRTNCVVTTDKVGSNDRFDRDSGARSFDNVGGRVDDRLKRAPVYRKSATNDRIERAREP